MMIAEFLEYLTESNYDYLLWHIDKTIIITNSRAKFYNKKLKTIYMPFQILLKEEGIYKINYSIE